jgi:hypothetical protein
MTYKLFAPRCSYPGCNNIVDYHKRYIKQDNTRSYKWKQACAYHRGVGKPSFDLWKLSHGCSNKDGHHGFRCTSTITSAGQIDINHIDGNKRNTDASNIECLCKVCHAQVTVDNRHYQNRYINEVILDPNLFTIEKC